MPDSNSIENHRPLLDSKLIERLDGLSKGLKLHEPKGQEKFLDRIYKKERDMTIDHVLEYLVNNRDVPLGTVISEIRLSKACNPARRIHWGAEQVKRHKERAGHLVDAQVSKEMVGSHA